MSRQTTLGAHAVAADDGCSDIDLFEGGFGQGTDELEGRWSQNPTSNQDPLLALTSSFEGNADGVCNEGQVVAMMQGPDDFGCRGSAGQTNSVTSDWQLGSYGVGNGFFGTTTATVP